MSDGSQIPSYPLKAPHKHMHLGWKLSEDEIFDIVRDDDHGAQDLSDLAGMKWAVRDGAFGDSPFVAFSKERGYYVLMVCCGAAFRRQFIDRHVRAVRECFQIPDSLDSTFGWHTTL